MINDIMTNNKLNAVDSSLLIADNNATPAVDVTVLTAQWHRYVPQNFENISAPISAGPYREKE